MYFCRHVPSAPKDFRNMVPQPRRENKASAAASLKLVRDDQVWPRPEHRWRFGRAFDEQLLHSNHIRIHRAIRYLFAQ
jgi:hypothetical protein